MNDQTSQSKSNERSFIRNAKTICNKYFANKQRKVLEMRVPTFPWHTTGIEIEGEHATILVFKEDITNIVDAIVTSKNKTNKFGDVLEYSLSVLIASEDVSGNTVRSIMSAGVDSDADAIGEVVSVIDRVLPRVLDGDFGDQEEINGRAAIAFDAYRRRMGR